ncbi:MULTISPECIES: ABC transporter substrate-binding protein [Ramlibacter]|uniref:Transporter substrate-binding domain-containing protein n=1 Tax=Ramlibacter pinisoli TaxID=2682844 RepID=A0A6N8IWR2_9BURK|nr:MULTISPECIES: ABC transporter substrate-binding protein [Ramlibacter]MBA2961050.1 ABC transporter substrate-binding protein [Ramlibacter sp. CGMCC 1.13660]MVQ30995.1 transporter substrate-binding domain-containing protein [Ramlibacter pinisoli]
MNDLSGLVAEAAPGGTLRVSINVGNAVLARRDGDSAAGVSVDLGREFARRLGVAADLLVFATAAESVDAVRSQKADLGFFAIDPKRSDGIEFSAPYVLIEGAYVVRDGSPLKVNEEVDRAGHRVVVAKGSAYDLFLSRELKQAEIVRVASSQAVVQEFVASGAEVAAGVKQQLEADLARQPGLRLLPGRFMVIQQAMGVPAGRPAVAEALRRFVEEMKAGGFVAQALARHGIQGAGVAPPAA